MTENFVGCCGWPEGKSKYFTRFRAVELQSTFYEPPSLTLARKWRDLAPPSFQFCLKAWQLITHEISSPTYRRLKSRLSTQEHSSVGRFQPTEQVALAWERTRAIALALHAPIILFQCPASFTPDPENLRNFRSFFSHLSRDRFLLAWEPRGNWDDELIAELCREFDLLHCVDPFQRTSVYGRPVYWRLHGRGGYGYRYTDADLAQLAQIFHRNVEQGIAPIYVFFNNIWMKEDAGRFQALL